ncbi:MAG: AAA family ATPase [Clostridiales bacterium]|nr:AAA family ATPase [Clostridiales bacterium]
MAFSELIGQKNAKSRLGAALTADPGHAFVLVGPPGIGKKSLAREFAKGLLCSHPTQDGGCGTCPNCIYMREHTHPDYRELMLPSGEKNIKVADVRTKILADVSIMSQIAARKVYLIDADYLGEEGQNALLKTLEEPPKNVVFILTVSDESRLLPTILSRTESIRLFPNTEEEVVQALTRSDPDILPEEATLFARFSNGIIGYARKLSESSWLTDAWEEVTDLLLRLPDLSRTELLTERYSFFDEEKEHFSDILSLMELVLGEMALEVVAPGADALRGEGKKDKISKMVRKYGITMRKIGLCSEALTAAAKAYKSNGNYEMIVCRMLLALKKGVM